jgi:hypothetical protein
MNNIYLYGFATFGHPNDYRQSPFKFDKKEIAKNVKIFDLPNAIKVFPNSTLYSIRKENIGRLNGVSYAIYTFANEMSSMRDGTFIGSSILFTNEIPEENLTVGKLNEFHSILTSVNTENDRLKVNHSDSFSHSSKFLEDFDKIGYHLKPISDLENFNSTNRHLVVGSWTNENNLTTSFKKSLLLLNKYDTIFFTSSKEILAYCQSRNIYSIKDEKGFELEIENLKTERKQKIQSSIKEFENEKQKLETDRKRVIDEHKYQIQQNEKLHQENSRKIEESKNELNKINQKYDSYSKKIDQSINNLKSDQKLEKVRQQHNEDKRGFIDSINQQTPLVFNKISKHQAKTELKQTSQDTQARSYEQGFSNHEKKKRRESKSIIFELLSAALFLLWIATLSYFQFFHKSENKIIETQNQSEHNEIQSNEQTRTDPRKESQLSPLPNTKLDENDYLIVAKKIKKHMPIEDIVQIIFDSNPSDIKSSYSNQIEEYGKIIIEKNKDCFIEDKNKYIYLKGTLKHIPSYNKQ